MFSAFTFSSPTFTQQVSSDVSAHSPIYEKIDELEALGCGYFTYRLFRPQTYFDLRSTVDITEDPEGGQVCSIPRWLRKEKQILMLRPGQTPKVSFSLLLLPDEIVSLPGHEATVAPSFPLWDRRAIGAGVMSYLDFSIHAQTGGPNVAFAFGVTPSVGVSSTAGLGTGARFYLYEAYAKATYKWAELEIAKKSLQFGNAAHGNLLLSGATAPITFARLGIRPHLLGVPLGFLGPTTLQTFVSADTGSVVTAGAHLLGIHLGFRPTPWFEFGLLQLYQFGGPDAAGLHALDILKMLVHLSDDDLDQRRQQQLAAHFGFHLIPSVQLYFQIAFERLGPSNAWFANDVSWLAGLWVANLGKLGLRFEYAQTTPSAYQSPRWKSGLVYEGTPIGHPLGPDAEGFYADLHFPDIKEFRPSLGGFYERRWRHADIGFGTESRTGAAITLAKRWIKTEFALVAKLARVENVKYKLGGATEVAAAQFNLRYYFL